jgi:aminopeptidase N
VAVFLRHRVGRAAFDQAMAVFYIWHVGKAAHMSDLIDTIEWLTRRDLDDLVQRWLKGVGPPTP